MRSNIRGSGTAIAHLQGMMTSRRYTRILAIVFTALSIGCSGELQAPIESEYDQANQQISEGNFNTAIAIMSQRLEDDPSDRVARLILASAFAARAGVFMNQYYDIGQQIAAKIKGAEVYWATHSKLIFNRIEENAKSSEQKSLLAAFESVYKIIYQINELIGIFSIIPTLSPADHRDLQQAVSILIVEPNYMGGAILYRGLLRLALLKNDLRTKYEMLGMANCEVNLSVLANQLYSLQKDVTGVMSDFISSSVKENKQSALFRTTAQINKNFDSARGALNSLSVANTIDVSILTVQFGGKCKK
ncbi:MAG: hypothetical protein KDD38_00025 [Bdellovibrionales bacterium]|nr:hypothetical protein [Bdellovibrionales bacterium]